jgi:hypothetical protein
MVASPPYFVGQENIHKWHAHVLKFLKAFICSQKYIKKLKKLKTASFSELVDHLIGCCSTVYHHVSDARDDVHSESD